MSTLTAAIKQARKLISKASETEPSLIYHVLPHGENPPEDVVLDEAKNEIHIYYSLHIDAEEPLDTSESPESSPLVDFPSGKGR